MAWFGNIEILEETLRKHPGLERDEEGNVKCWGKAPTVGIGGLEIVVPDEMVVRIDGVDTHVVDLIPEENGVNVQLF
jgi:hypothetical protein